jgi:hypothetical protein
MKHIKISAIALALTSFAATNALAQSTKTNAWEGVYGQAGVGYGMFVPSIGSGTAATKNTVVAPAGIPGVPAGTPLTALGYPASVNQNVSASNVNNVNTGIAALAAGYNFGITSEWLLGLAATYYPGASSGATGTLNVAPTSINGLLGTLPVQGASTTASYQVKNLYSIIATPGYALDKDRLVYGKVGYTGATIGLSAPTIAYNTTNLHGFTVGLGYKQILVDSIYAFGEINYASYGNSTASATTTTGTAVSAPIKGTGTDLLVGIGYRF